MEGIGDFFFIFLERNAKLTKTYLYTTHGLRTYLCEKCLRTKEWEINNVASDFMCGTGGSEPQASVKLMYNFIKNRISPWIGKTTGLAYGLIQHKKSAIFRRGQKREVVRCNASSGD